MKSLISIVGGGDTISAIKNNDLNHNFTHLSTAGGAFLEYIEKKLAWDRSFKINNNYEYSDIAKKMCAKGKGILAADEAPAQLQKDLKV